MLQDERIKVGLSQSQLGRASGISHRMIQNYEQGKNDINGAKLKTLCRFAIAMDCPISGLLSDDELIEMIKKVRLF